MRRDGIDGKWGMAGTVTLLLAPLAMILYLPLTLGKGLDVAALGNPGSLALAFCAPGVYVLLQYLGRQSAPARVEPAPER